LFQKSYSEIIFKKSKNIISKYLKTDNPKITFIKVE